MEWYTPPPDYECKIGYDSRAKVHLFPNDDEHGMAVCGRWKGDWWPVDLTQTTRVCKLCRRKVQKEGE